MNLIEDLQEELNRNRELLQAYRAIGSAGSFGAHFIEKDIKEGERTISEGDTVGMLNIYETLKNNC